MKFNMQKMQGAKLVAFDDLDVEKLNKFKTGEVYEVEIKLSRNPNFHRKVFSFLTFCFEHWKGDNDFQDEVKQFDVFRANLTVLAGFYDSFYKIDGSVRIEAKSLSYGSMKQEEFEQFYNAAINAALKHVFNDSKDEVLYQRLLSFF